MSLGLSAGILVPRYRNKTAAITAMTSIAGTTTGGTNQANIAFPTFGREARREAGLHFFERPRSLLLLARLVVAGLRRTLVLLRSRGQASLGKSCLISAQSSKIPDSCMNHRAKLAW